MELQVQQKEKLSHKTRRSYSLRHFLITVKNIYGHNPQKKGAGALLVAGYLSLALVSGDNLSASKASTSRGTLSRVL